MPENFDAEVGFDGQNTPFVRLRMAEFAESYPTIPILSIVRCLVEADMEAQALASEDDRGATAERLARDRLDELQAQYPAP